jgi:hypothetical protein
LPTASAARGARSSTSTGARTSPSAPRESIPRHRTDALRLFFPLLLHDDRTKECHLISFL